ncbi:MAG: hypothetical protein VYB44_07215 [Bacteroidota bacterium]|nr:hypothetical protein [Bacteroidota bacterium]
MTKDIQKEIKSIKEEIAHIDKYIVISRAKKREALTATHREPHLKDLEMWEKIKNRLEGHLKSLEKSQTTLFS